jgi:cation diffusion facilitator family transporter
MTPNKNEREKIGRKSGLILLTANLLLFLGKYIIGIISGSIAIIADAINNLTDTASAIATIIGFQMAMKPHDQDHPYGHGRAEYISGLIIACFIIVSGLALGQSAITHFFQAETLLTVNFWVIAIPAAAIAVKLALAIYLSYLERKIHSATLKAARLDCLSDVLITAITLITLLLAPLTSLPLDALVALAVAALIIYHGFLSFSENVSLLLGTGLPIAKQQQLGAIVDTYHEFEKINSIIVNDFGPQNLIVVLQLQPNKKYHEHAIQKAANQLSAELSQKFNFQTIVYWHNLMI